MHVFNYLCDMYVCMYVCMYAELWYVCYLLNVMQIKVIIMYLLFLIPRSNFSFLQCIFSLVLILSEYYYLTSNQQLFSYIMVRTRYTNTNIYHMAPFSDS
jgi:hypothetical protein